MELKLFRYQLFKLVYELLIVLHGIETPHNRKTMICHFAFNCTSWNWNQLAPFWLPQSYTFNCTSWNWNLWIRWSNFILIILLIVLHGIETTYPRTPAYFLPFNCTTTHRLFDTDGLQRVVHIYYDKDKWNPESRLNNWIRIRSYESKALACVCKLEKDRIVFKSWY